MVASQLTVAERFVHPPDVFLGDRSRFVRFTCGDVDALLKLGIIPEDATSELLDGMILLKDRAATGEEPHMIGQAHTVCVERLSDLRSSINNAFRHVRSQQPLVCSDIHMPEPDFMILRGALTGYKGRPTAADAWCVVEVADSSYERDTTIKLQEYARARVGQYIVINLRNRTAEIYTAPDVASAAFGDRKVVEQDQVLSLQIGETEFFSRPLNDILP